jgi:hypothetical protein
MSSGRTKLSQAEIDRIAKAARQWGVSLRVEKVAADGTKTVVSAGSIVEREQPSNGNTANGAKDLDRWIAEHENETKGH